MTMACLMHALRHALICECRQAQNSAHHPIYNLHAGWLSATLANCSCGCIMQVSPEVAAVAADADLVVLEGNFFNMLLRLF